MYECFVWILNFYVTNVRCASVDYSDVCVWLDPHVFVMWCLWVSWYVCMSGRLFGFALCTYLYMLVCVTYIHTRIQTHTPTYTHTYMNAYQNSLPYKHTPHTPTLYGRLFWYAFMYVCVYVSVCVCMRVCMYVTHTNIYKYVHNANQNSLPDIHTYQLTQTHHITNTCGSSHTHTSE